MTLLTEPRKVLVTGAARGIGAAICNRLDQDGYLVTALIRTRSTLEPLNPDVATVEGDIATMDRTAFVNEYGPFDVLVNNAAEYPPSALEDLDPDDFRRVLDVNLVAAVDFMKLVSGHMRVQRWGRIVNVGSITATAAWSGWAQLTAYASSKGALATATRIVARAIGPDNVTVNCLAPGAIPTAAEPAGGDENALFELQCLPFRGSVHDIAGVVAFLISEDARFVTGQTLAVDGGWTM